MAVGKTRNDVGRECDDPAKGCSDGKNKNEEGSGIVRSGNVEIVFDDEGRGCEHDFVGEDLGEEKGKNGCYGCYGRRMT